MTCAQTVSDIENILDVHLDVPVPIDLAQLADRVTSLLSAVGARGAVDPPLSANTMKYYRSQGIISAPSGTTSNAAFGPRHILEAATAKLGGYLRLVTISTKRPNKEQLLASTIPSMKLPRLRQQFLDFASRQHAKDGTQPQDFCTNAATSTAPTPARDYSADISNPTHVLLSLPGGILCLVPPTHPVLSVNKDALAHALSTAIDQAVAVH